MPSRTGALVHRERKHKHVTLSILWDEYIAQPGWASLPVLRSLPQLGRQALGHDAPAHAGGEKLFVDYAGEPVEVFDRLTGWLSRSVMGRRPILAANNQWMSANTGVEFTMMSSEPVA
jgi:hypothetical protein